MEAEVRLRAVRLLQYRLFVIDGPPAIGVTSQVAARIR